MQNELTRNDWLLAVRQRLDSLLDALVALKVNPRDSETLHVVRVACRRAEAVLTVCGDLLPRRHVAWLRKELSQLRRTCNSARDNDVLRKWLKGQVDFLATKLRKTLTKHRRIEQSQIVDVVASLLGKRKLARHAEQVCHSAANMKKARDARSFLARRLMNEVNQFAQALLPQAHDARQLHRLRIAAKRLRYACEFVSEVTPASPFEPLANLVRQVQERLGELHDLDVRQQCLNRLASRTKAQSLQRTTKDERDRLLNAWQAWWASSSPEATLVSASSELLRRICRCPPTTEVIACPVVPPNGSATPIRNWDESPSLP